MNVEIPDKTYFKIGEVASIIDVKPYIIRYWESEFRQLKPSKTRSGQRLFRVRDIELLLVIRTLVHEQRFTIAGARQQLVDIAGAGLTWRQWLDAPPTPGARATVEVPAVDASASAQSGATVPGATVPGATLGSRVPASYPGSAPDADASARDPQVAGEGSNAGRTGAPAADMSTPTVSTPTASTPAGSGAAPGPRTAADRVEEAELRAAAAERLAQEADQRARLAEQRALDAERRLDTLTTTHGALQDRVVAEAGRADAAEQHTAAARQQAAALADELALAHEELATLHRQARRHTQDLERIAPLEQRIETLLQRLQSSELLASDNERLRQLNSELARELEATRAALDASVANAANADPVATEQLRTANEQLARRIEALDDELNAARHELRGATLRAQQRDQQRDLVHAHRTEVVRRHLASLLQRVRLDQQLP